MTQAQPQIFDTGYRPRPLQVELHRKLKRFSCIVCHRRFGKSVFAINEVIDQGLRFNRDLSRKDKFGKVLKFPQYAYLAPTYSQAKRVMWKYAKEYTGNLPAVINEAELRIDIARPEIGDFIRIMLLGAENPASLKGIYLDGAVLDEYADMFPSTWTEAIYPTLLDRDGWAMFIGTPKGRNGFYTLYQNATHGFPNEDGSLVKDPKWFSALYKASETGILSEEQLKAARQTMSEEEYEQEMECSFDAGIHGAYFTKELAKVRAEGRIRKVPYDAAIPVDTYWDLGLNDVTAIWFIQSVRGEHRVIDYDQASDLSIPDWAKRVQAKGYYIGDAVLPHDAAARDLSTGRSREDMFRSLGFRTRVIARNSKGDSINAARVMLSKCVFDEEKTRKGLDALAQYQRKWDSKLNTFSDTPLHNHASNGADAFQQFALGAREQSYTERVFHDQAESDYDILSF